MYWNRDHKHFIHSIMLLAPIITLAFIKHLYQLGIVRLYDLTTRKLSQFSVHTQSTGRVTILCQYTINRQGHNSLSIHNQQAGSQFSVHTQSTGRVTILGQYTINRQAFNADHKSSTNCTPLHADDLPIQCKAADGNMHSLNIYIISGKVKCHFAKPAPVIPNYYGLEHINGFSPLWTGFIYPTNQLAVDWPMRKSTNTNRHNQCVRLHEKLIFYLSTHHNLKNCTSSNS